MSVNVYNQSSKVLQEFSGENLRSDVIAALDAAIGSPVADGASRFVLLIIGDAIPVPSPYTILELEDQGFLVTEGSTTDG